MNGFSTVNKAFRNSLVLEKLVKLTKEDRQRMVLKLLEDCTERQLEAELGIPRSTLHDWKTLRQSNVEENIHVSLTAIITKLEHFKPANSEDVQKLVNIKQLVERILAER